MIEARKDEWMPGGKLDEVKFCQLFVEEHSLVYADGAFFSIEGRIRDEQKLKQMIYQVLSQSYKYSLGRKVDSLLAALRLEAARKPLPVEDSVIHLANGTYRLHEGFTSAKGVCRFRLPVSFRPTLPNPQKWLDFLDDLLEPEDIETLQEFMGYCLIPTNVAQKMLFITGRGGEGKSRIGVVMRALLGDNMNQGSLYKVETNPFAGRIWSISCCWWTMISICKDFPPPII